VFIHRKWHSNKCTLRGAFYHFEECVEVKENNWEFDYAMEQLRLQRHDFMNFLQVIYGYLQINKPQEAINYIKEVNRKMTTLSQIFNLECPFLALFLQDLIMSCSKLNIEVELHCEVEYISSKMFTKNIDEKRIVFERVKSLISDKIKKFNLHQNTLYIQVSGSPEKFNIFIFDSEEALHKIKAEDNNYLLSNYNSENANGIDYKTYIGEKDFAVSLHFS
jgi:hypothetical protein